jgi:hypothetical protein
MPLIVAQAPLIRQFRWLINREFGVCDEKIRQRIAI